MQNVRSGELQCVSWDFGIAGTFLSIGIAVLLVLLTIYKRNISHIANSVALCLLHNIEWTTEGCVAAEVNGDVVTCNCNHLTNFAILVDSSE